MTRDDAITRLRRQLPLLRRFGVTGLSLTGAMARGDMDASEELDLVLDIDLANHPEFNMFTLGGIKADLEDDLGVTVWPLVLDGMREEARADIERELVRIA